MSNNNEMVIRDEANVIVVNNSPAAMMQAALSNGVGMEGIEKLERMMEFQERWDANEAKKAYFSSVADFKLDPPKIFKDRHVEYNKVKYDHASLGNVVEAISSSLAKYGLSISFNQTQEAGQVTVTCTMTHRQGYSESTSLSAPPDTSGSKNGIQAIGSTNAYLQRYTALAITGLATHDMDDDGVVSELQLLDVKQISTITDMVNSIVTDPSGFYGYLSGLSKTEITSPEDIPAKMYKQVIAELEILGGK